MDPSAFFRVLAGAILLVTTGAGHASAAPIPISYPAISFISASSGWVLAARADSATTATVLHTADAGRSWDRLARLSLPVNTPSMQFVDSRHGWITTIGPLSCGFAKTPPCHTVLLRTVDGGRHWSRLSAPNTNGAAITFVDQLHGWLIHIQMPCRSFCLQSLYATTDGGTTWRLLPSAPRFEDTRMSWINAEDGRIGGGNFQSCTSAIFATYDGGRTWTRQLALAHHCGLMQVRMLDPLDGWAVGGFDTRQCSMGGCDDYTLYRTVDGGRHWTVERTPSQAWWMPAQYAGGFPGPPLFVTPRYGWIPFSTGAGPGAGGVAITTNGGQTWRRVLGAYPLGETNVAPIDARNGWVAGTSRVKACPACDADLLHTTDGGKTWTKLHPQP